MGSWDYFFGGSDSDPFNMEGAYNWAAQKYKNWRAGIDEQNKIFEQQLAEENRQNKLKPNPFTWENAKSAAQSAASFLSDSPAQKSLPIIGGLAEALIPGRSHTASPAGSFIANVAEGRSPVEARQRALEGDTRGLGDVGLEKGWIDKGPEIQFGNTKPFHYGDIQAGGVNAVTDPYNFGDEKGLVNAAALIVPKGARGMRIAAIKDSLAKQAERIASHYPEHPDFSKWSAQKIGEWIDLHPAIGTHATEWKIYSPQEWTAMGNRPTIHAEYNPGVGGQERERLKKIAADKRLQRGAFQSPGFTNSILDYSKYDEPAWGRALGNNSISIQLDPKRYLASPQSLIEDIRHEAGHLAQDFGFTRAAHASFNDEDTPYDFKPTEVGARTTARKGARDYRAMGPAGEKDKAALRYITPSLAERQQEAFNEGYYDYLLRNKAFDKPSFTGEKVSKYIDPIAARMNYTSEGKLRGSKANIRPVYMDPETALRKASEEYNTGVSKIFPEQVYSPGQKGLINKDIRNRLIPQNLGTWGKTSIGWLPPLGLFDFD